MEETVCLCKILIVEIQICLPNHPSNVFIGGSFKIIGRNTKSEGPNFRVPNTSKGSALQRALLKFSDRTTDYIINPCVGTEFDHCDEAYEYYNLYSWECGFGIRLGKKRWSEKKRKNNQPDGTPARPGILLQLPGKLCLSVIT